MYLGLKWTDEEGDIHLLESLKWKVACEDICFLSVQLHKVIIYLFQEKKHNTKHKNAEQGPTLSPEDFVFDHRSVLLICRYEFWYVIIHCKASDALRPLVCYIQVDKPPLLFYESEIKRLMLQCLLACTQILVIFTERRAWYL